MSGNICHVCNDKDQAGGFLAPWIMHKCINCNLIACKNCSFDLDDNVWRNVFNRNLDGWYLCIGCVHLDSYDGIISEKKYNEMIKEKDYEIYNLEYENNGLEEELRNKNRELEEMERRLEEKNK